MSLRPCPYRLVDQDGHILCDKIKIGDRQVSPNICRACPITTINCTHLRATLDHRARPPITVRFGNGKTEVWDDDGPSISLSAAACSAKVVPITAPRDCAGCPLRQPLVVADAIAVRAPALRPTPSVPRHSPIPAPAAQPAAPIDDEPRKNLVAQKLAQLQEWLTKQKSNAQDDAPERQHALPIALSTSKGMAPMRGEEKRVGWTD